MVRKRRQTCGLSMTELAAQVGLTVGGVSQIERDLVNPTIPTLRRIASALGSPVFSFLMDDDPKEQIVVRHGQRREFVVPDYHSAYESLSPQTLQRFEVVRFSLPPGASSATEPVAHPGEEFIQVLVGSIRAEIGLQEYTLHDEDSIQFDSSLPHRYTNIGESTTELIGVMSPRWT